MRTRKAEQEPTEDIETLRARLEEVEEILRAIRSGQVDALMVSGPQGEQIYTLEGAERPYRVWIEAMQEGASTLSDSGLILYCNRRFAEMLGIPLEKVTGSSILSWIAPEDRELFETLLQDCLSTNCHAELALAGTAGGLPVSVALSSFPLDNKTAISLIATDLTAQHQREQEIALLQQTQSAVSEAPSLEAALRVVLRSIVEAAHWTYGEAWSLSWDGMLLECKAAYYGRSGGAALEAARNGGQHLSLGNGLVSEAWHARQMLYFPNLPAEAAQREVSLPVELGLNASLILPISSGDEVMAVLAFFTREMLPIDEHFVRIVSTVASQLGTFIQRKRAEDALQRAHQELEGRVILRTAELQASNELLQQEVAERRRAEAAEHEQRMLAEALRDTAMALNGTLELPEVLNLILMNVGRVVPHDTADIMLMEGDETYVARCRGYAEHGLEETLLALRFSYRDLPALRQIVETRQPVVIADITQEPGWVSLYDEEWRHAYIGLPIRSLDQVIGFLNLSSTEPGFFTPHRVEALQAFAEQAAVAVQNARLHEQAQHLAAMKERERLARDLHDAVSQTLFSANMMAEALPRQWERNPSRAQEQLGQLHQMTRGAMAEMRTLLLELRPTALIEAEMGMLLTQLADAIQSRKKIVITVKVDGKVALPQEAKLSFYRIAQEALNNVAKHSRATRAEIQLFNRDGWVELNIVDNGRGFDPNHVGSTSLGLGIMHERAAVIGAALTITTAPSQGTQVNLRWDHRAGAAPEPCGPAQAS